MVSSVGSQLHLRSRISGFGVRRRTRKTGRGIVRRVLGTVARPALGFIANKIADMISGTGIRRRRTVRRRRVTRGTSYRLTGMGRRAPRRRLGVRRTVRRTTTTRRPVRSSGCGVRRPRRRLAIRRRRY